MEMTGHRTTADHNRLQKSVSRLMAKVVNCFCSREQHSIDITAAQRKVLEKLLQHHVPGTTVWAYGSRAKGRARPSSDLDLVVFATPAQRKSVSELRDALNESNLPFMVDLHIWDEVPKSFHDIIRAGYVVVQSGTDESKA